MEILSDDYDVSYCESKSRRKCGEDDDFEAMAQDQEDAKWRDVDEY